MKKLEHLKQTNYWIKWVLVVLVGSFVLKHAAENNVTLNDFFTAFAQLNILFVLAVELLDKVSDRFDYVKWFDSILPEEKRGGNYGLFGAIVIAAAMFFIALYISTGTLVLSLGEYSAGVLLAAAIPALYVVAPETGDDELIFWLWVISQIITGGAYISVALNPTILFSMFNA